MTKHLLQDLRLPLLGLHKALVEFERRDYERSHHKLTPNELLHLLIQDPQFAWLHTISELIVRIDELTDAKQEPTEEEIRSVIRETRKLLNPMEVNEVFGQRYQQALRRDPDVVMAHRQVRAILSTNDS